MRPIAVTADERVVLARIAGDLASDPEQPPRTLAEFAAARDRAELHLRLARGAEAGVLHVELALLAALAAYRRDLVEDLPAITDQAEIDQQLEELAALGSLLRRPTRRRPASPSADRVLSR